MRGNTDAQQTTHTLDTTMQTQGESLLSVTAHVTAAIPVGQMDLFIRAMRAAGHDAQDTGDRISTEEGVDAEGYVDLTLRG